MSSSDTQIINLDVLPLIAALVGASISIFFNKISFLNDYEGSNDPGWFMTIITVFALYFFAFYSISRILLSKPVSLYLLGGIFLSSLFIMFIGVSDIRGRFLKIYLGLLTTTLLMTLWKAGIRKMHKWDILFIYLFLLSSAYAAISSSELQIENEGFHYDKREDGYIHGTFSFDIRALKYDAKNIRVKLICSEGVSLHDVCALSHIHFIEKDKTEPVEWDITFEDKSSKDNNSYLLYLYFMSSDEICNKKIILMFDSGKNRGEPQIINVGFFENLKLFLEHSTIL